MIQDLVNHLSIGFSVALSPTNLLVCLIGCLGGTLIGVLPGIGPVTTIALMLPLTFYLEPVSGLIMLAGIFYGAQYGGSTTAILVNMPGETSSVVTALDGYEMAKQGRAGPALTTAALVSLFAGIVSTLVICLAAPPLALIGKSFGAPEYCALMTLGLIGAVVIANGSILKALGMVLVGLLLGIVGIDLNTGDGRFTFDLPTLMDGIDFVPISVGIFGLGEIMSNLRATDYRPVSTAKLQMWPTARGRAPSDSGRDARHCGRLRDRHSARRRRGALGVHVVHGGEAGRARPVDPRQGRDRGCGGAGSGQQRRRADLVHPHADAGHSRQCGDGRHGGGADDPRHQSGSGRHHGKARPVLGHHRQHVHRQRHAGDHQPAADRHLGQPAAHSLPRALPRHHRVLRHRILRASAAIQTMS